MPEEAGGEEDADAQQEFKSVLDQGALVLEKVAEAAGTLEEHSRTAGANAEGDARARKKPLEAMRDLLSMSFERWALNEVLALRAQTKAGGWVVAGGCDCECDRGRDCDCDRDCDRGCDRELLVRLRLQWTYPMRAPVQLRA